MSLSTIFQPYNDGHFCLSARLVLSSLWDGMLQRSDNEIHTELYIICTLCGFGSRSSLNECVPYLMDAKRMGYAHKNESEKKCCLLNSSVAYIFANIID